jgi:hypothetical protein
MDENKSLSNRFLAWQSGVNWKPIAAGFGLAVLLIIITKKEHWLGTN